MQDDDLEAGGRLQAAVSEAYGKPGRVRNENQLSKASGISRSVFANWWTGTQPEPRNMRRMAEALGVTPESLWLRWLGYETPEPGLSRIANEISDLRDVISAVSRRGADAERRDWDAERDPDRRAGDEPPDEPDTPPA